VIHVLEAGEVQCIMITGNSVLMGIHIAKEAGRVKIGAKVYLCSERNAEGEF
jgi:magnesium-transporting ATPase (P-type)